MEALESTLWISSRQIKSSTLYSIVEKRSITCGGMSSNASYQPHSVLMTTNKVESFILTR